VAGADEQFRNAVEREFRSSVLGVTCAAFAINAFYASTIEHAPVTKVQSESRKSSILETLKLAYEVRGAQQETARRALYSVFDFRDQAVHPPASSKEPVQHPTYGLGVEPKFVIFRMENARRATDFTHRLLWFCTHKPKQGHKALCEWCRGVMGLIPEPPEARKTP
jgi:hypothetical protein